MLLYSLLHFLPVFKHRLILFPGVRGRCTFMENDIITLSKGCQFWKVRSGTDWYLRRFWLDMERMCLRYVPSQKPFWNSCPTHGKYPHYSDLYTLPSGNADTCSRDKFKTALTVFLLDFGSYYHLSLYLVPTILLDMIFV